MYTNSRSPTFVEILIAVVVLFAVIGIFVRGCNNEEGAKKEAEKWSSQMYPGEKVNIVCQDVDTDGNGYVSCTIKPGDKNPIALECSVNLSWNDGCRLPILRNVQGN
jgi:hypothetical protein